MKKLVILITILIFGLYARATHIVGAEMRYECIGNNEFKILIDVYHDCDASVPSNTISLYATSTCNQTCLSLPQADLVEVANVDVGCESSCDDPTIPTLKKTTYSTIVNLDDYNCSNIKVWCKVEARASSTYSPGSGFYQNYIYINNAGNICNNSPVFSNEPYILGCQNSAVNYNNSYTDIENDQVIFELTEPLKGENCDLASITYTAPQSFTSPFPSSSGFQFNNTSGDISFTTSNFGTSFFGILVKEFRNGILISETIRDGSINVIQCEPPNAWAYFNNWQNSSSHNLVIERYEDDCFNFNVYSATAISNAELTGLPNFITYSVTGIGGTSVTFSVCPNYAEMPNDCENLAYGFNALITLTSPCDFNNTTAVTNDNYNLIVEGNTYCQSDKYYTNINPNDPINANSIPIYTKVSNKIWVGDNMPNPGYNELIDGPTGEVFWNNDFTMEAGVEIILPSCITGTSCVTLHGSQTLIIKPNNCNEDCETTPLDVKLREIFECGNERVEALVIGGEPPYSYVWTVNGISSNDAIFNVHNFVYGSDTPINYSVQIFDAVGNEYSGSGQVLGTSYFYEPLSDNGVIYFDYPPNSGIFTDGWYYAGQPGVDYSTPFFIADSVNTSAPWYGAHMIELTIWDRASVLGPDDPIFLNDIIYNKTWSLEGTEDWSIDNGDVNWNGHWNNDFNESCVGGALDIFVYRVEARNCYHPGNTDPILNTDEDLPPQGHHIETSGGLILACYQESSNWYDNISEAHGQQNNIPSDTSNFRPFIALDNTLNISPESENYNIDIYPNPTTDIFQIEGDLSEINQLIIYDTKGKVIYNTTSINNEVSMTNYENGVYLIKLVMNNKIIFRRIIKQ